MSGAAIEIMRPGRQTT